MKLFFSLILMTLLSIGLFPSSALSEPPEELPWEKFSIGLGGFLTTLDSNVRIGGNQHGIGMDIDVEKALGLDTRTSIVRGAVLYRFSDNLKHRIDVHYFDLRRNSTKVLETDIEINDQIYPVGTTIESHFNVKIFKTSYSYSFFMDDRIDARVTAGLYVMPLEMGIASPDFGAEGTDFIAPLPTFGLGFNFAFTPDLILKQNIETFYLEIDEYRGLMSDFGFFLEYNRWKNFGIGGGFNVFRLNIEADGEDYPNIDLVGNIKFAYTGLMLYGKYYFK